VQELRSRRDSPADVVALLRLVPQSWPDLARRLRAGETCLQLAQELGVAGSTLFDDADPWDKAREQAELELEGWRAEGLTVVTAIDDRYPARLDVVRTRPPILWARGSADSRDSSGVAIVGSRRASMDSMEAAGRLARGLVEHGLVVISGLAAGVDTAALTGAREAGGRAVAVIGTGIRRVYPSENAALQQEIAEHGLLVSQFWPDAPPTKFSFPMRNELMSGWASATLVIQADQKSGARMQARVATEQRRLVLLYEPALQHEAWARAYVDGQRATFVSSLTDVLGALGDNRAN
jgi:DNA processing protein